MIVSAVKNERLNVTVLKFIHGAISSLKLN